MTETSRVVDPRGWSREKTNLSAMEFPMRPAIVAQPIMEGASLGESDLGCCGYPDVIYTSKTTSPIFNSAKIPPVFKNREEETVAPVEIGARTGVRAVPVENSLGQNSGLSQQEAYEFGTLIWKAIKDTKLALERGEDCFRVTTNVLSEAQGAADRLLRFSSLLHVGNKMSLSKMESDAVDKVLECAGLQKEVGSERNSKNMVLLAGGILLGTAALIVAAS